MKFRITVFRVVTMYLWASDFRRFEGTYLLLFLLQCALVQDPETGILDYIVQKIWNIEGFRKVMLLLLLAMVCVIHSFADVKHVV